MQSAIETAAHAAEKAGAMVKEITLPPIFEQAIAAHSVISAYESARALAFEYDRHRERLGPIVREQLEQGTAISADAYDDARRTASRARQLFLDVLADGTVILTPSATGAAPRGNESGAAAFNRLWSLLGTPCVNVPALTDPNGMPLGLQIVARFGRDRFALSAAAFLQRALENLAAGQPAAAQAGRLT
jgi:Asp-tRNA(Asn)/Glu-tRNA(Gln) amidotransferase A subunit family amidase